MQDGIKKRKKIAPIVCTLVVIAVLGAYLATVLFPLMELLEGESIGVGIFLLYALIIGAVFVGVLLALRQRLKEIEGGEEEEASQY